jgi:succinoglycan biosynthesis protein ExoA
VFRQYLQYGYWKPFVMKKHGQPARPRQLVPALFVAALALFAIMAVVGWRFWPLALLLLAYAGAVGAMTVAVLRDAPQPPAVALRVPAVIATYHFAYGIGTIIGAFDVLRGRPGRERFAKLSR